MAYNEKECYILLNREEITVAGGVDLVELEFDDGMGLTTYTITSGIGATLDIVGWFDYLNAVISITYPNVEFEYKNKEFVYMSHDSSYYTVKIKGKDSDFCSKLGMYTAGAFMPICYYYWGYYRCIINGGVGSIAGNYSIYEGYSNLLTAVDGDALDIDIESLVTTDVVANSGFLRSNSFYEFTFEVRFNSFWMIKQVDSFMEYAGGATGESSLLSLENFPDDLAKAWIGGYYNRFKLNIGSDKLKRGKIDRFERALWFFTLALIGGYHE